MSEKVTQAKHIIASRKLHTFIGRQQLACLGDLLRGEEREAFAQKVIDIADTIDKMPKTYETNEQGEDAIVHLHYFRGGVDAWITEKDKGYEDAQDEFNGIVQNQAFGKITLTGDKDDAEFGYISIAELIACNVELDFYWEPKPLKDC